jgi:hypothetical protein
MKLLKKHQKLTLADVIYYVKEYPCAYNCFLSQVEHILKVRFYDNLNMRHNKVSRDNLIHFINRRSFTELELLKLMLESTYMNKQFIDTPDLARDLRELLIIAHRVPDETDRRAIADIAEKWLRKLPNETS